MYAEAHNVAYLEMPLRVFFEEQAETVAGYRAVVALVDARYHGKVLCFKLEIVLNVAVHLVAQREYERAVGTDVENRGKEAVLRAVTRLIRSLRRLLEVVSYHHVALEDSFAVEVFGVLDVAVEGGVGREVIVHGVDNDEYFVAAFGAFFRPFGVGLFCRCGVGFKKACFDSVPPRVVLG